MLRTLYFLILTLLSFGILTTHTVYAQKKDDIKSKINRLMEDYSLYSDFTEDGSKISNHYKEQFGLLFAEGAEVFNDLPTTPTYGTVIKTDKYISTLIDWFPKGISTSYTNRKIMDSGVPVQGSFVGKYDTVYVVSVSKTINGRNKNKDKLEPRATALFMVVGYNRREDRLKIINIQNKYQEARYLSGLPGKYEGKGSIETQKYIKSRPLFLSLGIMPGFSNISANTTDISTAYTENFGSALTQSGGFGWAANVQVLVGLSKRIGFGLGVGLSQYRSTLNLSNFSKKHAITDADGKEGMRDTKINNFTESLRQTYLQVPLFLRFDVLQTDNVNLFLDLGVAPGFSLSDANTYSGTFSAENEYTATIPNSTFDYTLSSIQNPTATYDEAHNTHLGLYNNLTIDQQTPASAATLKSSNFMALGGLGITYQITDKLAFSGSGRVYYGLSNLQQASDNTGGLWVNALRYNSLYHASNKLKTFMGGLEIGIVYTLKQGGGK